MPYSYNGWYASPNLNLRPLVVAGESFVPGVLDDDDVWTVFNYLVNRLHNEVEPIVRSDWHQADDWGYNYRLTTNATTLSCHSSATAIDYNSTRHPFGVSPYVNFSQAQIDKIHEIIADLPIVWGGDYRDADNKDAMHYEIAGSKATVAAAAARIRNGQMEDDEMQQADFERIRSIVSSELEPVQAELKNVIAKLGNSREREVATNALLRELRDEVDADSPTRRKLDRILALQKADADAETPPAP